MSSVFGHDNTNQTNRNQAFVMDLYGQNGNNNAGIGSFGDFSGLDSYGKEPDTGFTAKDGINTALGAYNLYLAKKGLNLSQENFDFRKKATAKNYNASAKSYNTQLYDLYAGRLGGSGQFNRGTEAGRASLAAAVEAKASKKYISPNF